MECSRCKKKNKDYYNYCENDGELLDYSTTKSVLKQHKGSHCSQCGSKVLEKDTYCGNCGSMLDRVCSYKKELNINNSLKVENESLLDMQKINIRNFNISKFKEVDMRGIVLNLGLTLISLSILVAILVNVVIPKEIFEMQDLGISKFEAFMSNLVNMNVASLDMSLKVALVNAGNISIVARNILNVLITISIIGISSSICLNKDETRGNRLENCISYAIIYSIIMVFIGFLASSSMTIEEGVILKLNFNILSIFINSLIISFIGVYLGVSKGEISNKLSVFFKDSLKIVVLGFVITTVVLGILLYSELDKQYMVSEMINYYLDDFKLYTMMFIIVYLSIFGSWLFALSNFASFGIFGIASYNILSLSKEVGMPVIIFSLVPAVLLILMGRKIKNIHRDDSIKTISIFSGIYSLVMGGFAYFTRIILSANLGQLESFVTDFVYGQVSYFSYEYADIIQGYLTQIYSKLNSGLAIGPNIFVTIIGSFIFSFICVYLGGKSKKIEQI